MNNYKVLEVVGQGQYGTAYKAQNVLDGQLYCIKRIPMTAKDDMNGALREVQVLSSLNHPNIIGYKESFVDANEALCIVTTFCEEGDLFRKIRNRSAQNTYFSEDEVMDMFIQIASSLMYIHSKKVLHRDLKTQNIFVARGGIIKLGDFGISKVFEKTDQFATTVTGTPYYMAPEICTSQPYTFKSDIWSLGCVLYEMCTLKHAFAADSLLSLVYQIVRGDFPPIPDNVFSTDLGDLVGALLQRDAANRPSLHQVFTMPYVQEQLRRYQRQERARLLERSSSMSRRARQIERGMADMSVATPQAAAGSSAGRGAADALGPKQRAAAKREEDIQRRQLELRVATMNNQAERHTARSRKDHMLHGSSAAARPSQQQQQGGWRDPYPASSMSSLSSNLRTASDSAVGLQGSGYGYRGPGDVDDSVNLGTMPASGGDGRAGSSRQGNWSSAAASSVPNAGVHSSWGRDEVPVAAAARQHARATSNGPADDVDDSVLMGTMMEQSRASRMGASAAPLDCSRRAAAPGSGIRFGVEASSSYDTQYTQQQSRPNSAIQQGQRKIMFGMRSESRPRGSFDYVIRSVDEQLNEEPLGAAASDEEEAGAYRPHGHGAPILEGEEEDDEQQYSYGGRQVGHAGHSNGHQHSHAAAQHSGYGGGDVSGGDDEDSYEDDFEDYEDDGFEEYEEEEEEEDPEERQQLVQEVQQRRQIVHNMMEISRSLDGAAGGGGCSVSDRAPVVLHDAKLTALHERAAAALGPHFDTVYRYLRAVRTRGGGGGGGVPDEREVQRRLLELLGGDRSRMQGCFVCDQLVFQEMMHS